jgi:hypothetical protein
MDTPTVRFDLPDANGSLPRMFMHYVALKLNEKSLDDKQRLATTLGANFTTYIADYPSPPVPPAQLTTKVNAINTKKIEVGNAQSLLDAKLTELDNLEIDLDNALTTDGIYIDEKSGGVEAKILELGVDVQATRTPPSTPGQLQNFRLLPGDNAGEVKTACKSNAESKGYQYETTTDPNHPELWTLKDSSGGCRHVLKGFPSGLKVYVRARGIGKKNTGNGPWSDIASITVP